MKSTLTLLSILSTFFLTWMTLAFLVWLFYDDTFKEVVKYDGVVAFALFLNIFTCSFVGMDVYDYLTENQ